MKPTPHMNKTNEIIALIKFIIEMDQEEGKLTTIHEALPIAQNLHDNQQPLVEIY